MTQNQPEASTEEKYPRYRWVVIILLVASQQLATLLTGGIGMLLPTMRESLGFGIGQSGVLGSLGYLASTFLSIPASMFLVRFNPKRVFLVALVFAALMGFLCGRAATFAFLAIFFCLLGVSTVLMQSPDTLLKVQWIPRREYAKMVGITMGMMAMSQSVGVIIIPFLLDVLGSWRNLFSIYALALVLTAIVWIIFARERITPAYHRGMSSISSLASLKGTLSHKEFILLCIAVFGGPLSYTNTFLFLPTYLLEERAISLTTIGFIVGLMPIGGVCANLVMGLLSSKIGLRRPTIWPAGFVLPLLYLGLFSHIPEWSLPLFTFVLGFVAWAPFPALRTIPFELPGIKPSEVAVGQSLMQAINSLAAIVGAPAVGYLAQLFGSTGMALRVLCVFPLAHVAAGLLLPETGPKARLAK